MVGAAIDDLRPEGRGVEDLGVGLGPKAQDGIGRRPPARYRRLHQAVVHRRRRQQAGKRIEHRQAERQRRHHQRRGAPAIAAKQHDACNGQHAPPARTPTSPTAAARRRWRGRRPAGPQAPDFDRRQPLTSRRPQGVGCGFKGSKGKHQCAGICRSRACGCWTWRASSPGRWRPRCWATTAQRSSRSSRRATATRSASWARPIRCRSIPSISAGT